MKVNQFYQTFQHFPGLEFYEDSVHTIKCELLYFDAVLFDECTIYLDFHKWVLQNFDAIFYAGEIAPFIWTIINGYFKNLDAMFYGGGIAPFIWTIINGCFKIWM